MVTVFNSVKIQFIVFNSTPESLYENIVDCTAFSVHRYLSAFQTFNVINIILGGKLAPLITVYNLVFSVLGDGPFYGGSARMSFHRVGQRPAYNAAAPQIHYGKKVKKPLFHRYVGNVHGPHLVYAINFKITQ